MVYIHIMVEEQRGRMNHATDARGSCGATEGVRGTAATGGAGGGAPGPASACRELGGRGTPASS